MKPIGCFILLSLFSLKANAQDTLYTVAGEKICAKVTEITETELKYKKTSNLDGPTYVVNKNTIALIEYKNGTKELLGTGAGANQTNPDQVTRNGVVINNYDNSPFYGWFPRVRIAWASPFYYGSFGNNYRPFRHVYRGHRHHHHYHFKGGRYR